MCIISLAQYVLHPSGWPQDGLLKSINAEVRRWSSAPEAARCGITANVWRNYQDDLRVLIISNRQHQKEKKKRKQTQTEQSEKCLWCFGFDGFLAQEQQTHRQALTLQPQTDGSWQDNAIWFHMPGDNASAHRCPERREERRGEGRAAMIWQRGGRERVRGGNNECKVQDLRFLPALLLHLRLTLAAAQSNMPLCWRGRAMGTCFLLFSWLKLRLGMLGLSWWGLLKHPQWCKPSFNDAEKKKISWICSFSSLSLRGSAFKTPLSYMEQNWCSFGDDHTKKSLHHILLQVQFHESLTHKCPVTFWAASSVVSALMSLIAASAAENRRRERTRSEETWRSFYSLRRLS